jgi:hypothetical protein
METKWRDPNPVKRMKIKGLLALGVLIKGLEGTHAEKAK